MSLELLRTDPLYWQRTAVQKNCLFEFLLKLLVFNKKFLYAKEITRSHKLFAYLILCSKFSTYLYIHNSVKALY
jgi:hypothetical protein